MSGVVVTAMVDVVVLLPGVRYSNAANNTATMNVSTVAVPDMGVDLSGLPTAFTAGTLYSGRFVCKNGRSADRAGHAGARRHGIPCGPGCIHGRNG